jgi:hypothetical protein
MIGRLRGAALPRSPEAAQLELHPRRSSFGTVRHRENGRRSASRTSSSSRGMLSQDSKVDSTLVHDG